MSENIKEADLPYSERTQGLLTSGLMYQSIIDGNGEQGYSFTPLAALVDQYAASYENVEKYPNPRKLYNDIGIPKPKLPEIVEYDEISSEEIDDLFEGQII